MKLSRYEQEVVINLNANCFSIKACGKEYWGKSILTHYFAIPEQENLFRYYLLIIKAKGE